MIKFRLRRFRQTWLLGCIGLSALLIVINLGLTFHFVGYKEILAMTWWHSDAVRKDNHAEVSKTVFVYSVHETTGTSARDHENTTIVIFSSCIDQLSGNLFLGDRNLSVNIVEMSGCGEHLCGMTGYFLTMQPSEYKEVSALLPAYLPTYQHETSVTKHHLTSCQAPLMFFTDWMQLVDFAEIWHASGLTRMHVYWQSVSNEVRHIMRFYEQTGNLTGLQMRLHEWPSLPDNVMSNMFIYGQLTSYHDCLLHNRLDAHFTAFPDLDELPFVAMSGNQTMVEYLNFYVTSSTYIVNIFRLAAYANNNSTEFVPRSLKDCVTTSEHNLLYLKDMPVDLESVVDAKHIVRPDKVDLMQVHYVTKMRDNNSDMGSVTITGSSRPLSQPTGPQPFMLHVRRRHHSEQVLNMTGRRKFSEFNELAVTANSNWRLRTKTPVQGSESCLPTIAYYKEMNTMTDLCQYDNRFNNAAQRVQKPGGLLVILQLSSNRQMVIVCIQPANQSPLDDRFYASTLSILQFCFKCPNRKSHFSCPCL